jgi:hypothetical protein
MQGELDNSSYPYQRDRRPDLFHPYRDRNACSAGQNRTSLRESGLRVYSASSEETLRARTLLKDWAGEGFLTPAQYELLQKETASDLRTTNIFLRLVLFLFTLVSVIAATGLFFVVFLERASNQTSGIFLLILSGICYAAAEGSISRFQIYRYGIEEALVVCSTALLCAGMQFAFFRSYDPPATHAAQSLIPAVGAVFSLWIWRRFGLPYAFLAAMIFVVFPPDYWTVSHSARHLIIAMFYAGGLAVVTAVRSRHRMDYLRETYSLAEAMLWIGIYLSFNLQLSSFNLSAQWWNSSARPLSDFTPTFYWATWVLIWCLPPVVLVRGVRQKDRALIAAGTITGVLTLASNKPYLGWPRHAWDPMLLGAWLTAVAWFIQRWLDRAPGGIRHGFTAARLSVKDKHWMSIGSSVLGLVSPQAMTPEQQMSTPEFRFGGGKSGGGGASSDF